jgi:GT2 family glycosyltransferase
MLGLQTEPMAALARTAEVAVSVCIANWNCRELLRRCLESLFEQPQGVGFEVIVADNGSTDGAAEMVASEFPQVRLIRNESNRGFSIASNQAASVARGRLLFFLNNDTVIPENSLRELKRFFDNHPHVGMAGPRLRGKDGRNQISYRRRPTLRAMLHRVSLLRWTGLFRKAYYDYRRSDYRPDGVQRVEILMGAAVVLPREIYRRCGGWDEAFRFGVEDIDLSTQVGKHKPVMFLGNVEIVHYGREASRGNISFAAPNVAIGYVRYFRKAGATRLALVAYKLLVTLDTPLQLLGKLGQGGLRYWRGREAKAAKSWLAARGLWHFLRNDLGRFWRA